MRHFLLPSCLLITLVLGVHVHAQQNDVPLQREIYLDLDRSHAEWDTTRHIHTGLRPYIESRANTKNTLGYRVDTKKYYYTLTEKLFKEHLLLIKGKDFKLTADPLFNFEFGKDFRDPTRYADTTILRVNTRGFRITGDLGPNFSFQTTFHENQTTLPQYLVLYSQKVGVVPGQGRAKDFNGRGFDFAWATGNISWTPKQWLNLQFGQGRHFVGHGYRSLLLSDVAYTYPYVKSSLLFFDGRVQYSTIFAKLQALERLPTGESAESLFYWKRATFDHISIDLGRVQLGLFEASQFETIDSNGVRPLNGLELNPVPFVNTIAHGFGDRNKQLVGLDLKVKLTDKAYLYGQFATDGPADQRFAWQAGARIFDLFRKDLHVQLEYNVVEPYMYANDPRQMNHGHYGQPLAHPMGANLSEAVLIVDHRIDRWWITAKFHLAQYQVDPSDTLNFGGDIFKPLNDLGSGGEAIDRTLHYADLRVAYLLNQMYNMQFSTGYKWRELLNAPDQLQSGYFYVSWSTNMFNKYYDF